MVKRFLDICLSACGLLVISPLLLGVMLAIWLQDRHSPFYIAQRVGRGDTLFMMVKLRSMVVRADATGVDSTAGDDPRITSVGRFVRRYKLDEVMQLWNVLRGDMSLVGPRPNVKRETDLYTSQERDLLLVRPGITDIASIVFADEGDILDGREDPDLAYNQLIRPWKSRLGLIYVQQRSVFLDLRLVALTALAIVSRRRALDAVQGVLCALGVDGDIRQVARREEYLVPHPPPGSTEIVTHR
jgi:lipopolysaccharide/colanic/teichoic acid biosynthesis glycosyltransferase